MSGTDHLSQILVWLDANQVARESVGGKGASLSALYALGAPVPLAYALTTTAYAIFADSCGFPTRASQVANGELAALRQEILAASLPPEIRSANELAWKEMAHRSGKTQPLAVRSSATAEDSAAFSFAGLHDTILDVLDCRALEKAILHCWASLWTDRAIEYRKGGGLELDVASMAVVVQQLVHSDVSFVVFTVDPISNHDDHLIINASYGLGEAVVSGLVTPDVIVINSAGEVENYEVGEKETMIIPGEQPGEGVRQVQVPRMLARLPALSTEQACEIGRVAREISERLGYPADIEGGFSNGELFLCQVRPITTLSGQSRK